MNAPWWARNKKAIVGAVGLLLTGLVTVLPPDSKVGATLGLVVAAGATFGIWKAENAPAAPGEHRAVE